MGRPGSFQIAPVFDALIADLKRSTKLFMNETRVRFSILVPAKPRPATSGRSHGMIVLGAAVLRQVSPSPILVSEARRRGLTLSMPSRVTKSPVEGMTGMVDGWKVGVGGEMFFGSKPQTERDEGRVERGALNVTVQIEGVAVGTIVMEDRLREDAVEAERLHDGWDSSG